MLDSVNSKDDALVTLPQWLQTQAARQGGSIALRHKRQGIWQVRTWRQTADEVLALAAQWLDGVATLLDPLEDYPDASGLLHELNSHFVFAEGLAEIERLERGELRPRLVVYADSRSVASALRSSEPRGTAVEYAHLLAQTSGQAPAPQARGERTAFAFYRHDPAGRIERQQISHAELLQEARRLVDAEKLSPREEALAARTFAAGGQARYLLAPWLLVGFRLNFPENLATRDNDRRELGPTLVAGTRMSYERLHALAWERLPKNGWRGRLVSWALADTAGGLQKALGYWLVRRPLQDILGFSRTRSPLLVGDPLPVETLQFFSTLGIAVRSWPDPAQWHAPPARKVQQHVDGWFDGGSQLA